jgi:PTH2 family peptidyl-tRNA hydrolase
MIWLTSRIRTKPNWIIRFFLWLFRRTAAIRLSTEEQEWIDGSFTKITLQVDSQDELLRYYTMAKSKGLTVSLVTDAGKTEFNGVPTFTAIAIGPHEASRIDEVTRSLKLY